MIRTQTAVLQKQVGYVATAAKCKNQCFQKETQRDPTASPALKAMITFISATYYLFLKPYNHDYKLIFNS